jgi:hypothetical protein
VSDIFHSGWQGGAGGNTSSIAVSTGHTATGTTSATNTATNGTTTNGPTTTDATSTTTAQTATSVTTVATTVNVVSASSGPGHTVSCGLAGSCMLNNNTVCCYDSGTHTSMCTQDSNCQQTGNQLPTAISCAGPMDCHNGDICCAVRYFNADNQPYEFAQCQNGCDLPDRVVCDITNPDCPIYTNTQGMPVQSTCKASTLLPTGYYVCGF